MHNQKVSVTIDGREVMVHAGVHSFNGLLAELGVDDNTLLMAGANEQTIGLDVVPPPPQATRITGNGSYCIHGRETFSTIRQPVPGAV